MAPIVAAYVRPVAHLLLTLGSLAGAVAPVAAQPGGVGATLASERMMPKFRDGAMTVNPVSLTTGGTVDVEIVVDVTGSVAHARVAASSDSSGALDRACLAALTAARFSPVTDAAGRPQASLSLARFTFSAPAANDRPGTVSVALAPLPPVPPPTLEENQLAGVADAKQVRYSSPRPLRRINPRYTEDAMRAKIQGLVTMELIVLADGTVGAARVTKPLHEGLDREALVAARYWYFDPARVDGRAVATKAVLQLEFNLR